jgi:hypothetical protein
MIYQHLGDTRALDAIHRGMNIYLLTQQGALVRVFRRQFIVDLNPKPRRLARVQSTVGEAVGVRNTASVSPVCRI